MINKQRATSAFWARQVWMLIPHRNEKPLCKAIDHSCEDIGFFLTNHQLLRNKPSASS